MNRGDFTREFFNAVINHDKRTIDATVDHTESSFDFEPYYMPTHALIHAVSCNDAYAVEKLLERRRDMDVNSICTIGRDRPLHWTVYKDAHEALEVLLKTPDIRLYPINIRGKTPLEMLLQVVVWKREVSQGKIKTLSIFLRHGVELPSDYDSIWKRILCKEVIDVVDRVRLAQTLMSARCKRIGGKSKLNTLPDDLLKKLIKDYF